MRLLLGRLDGDDTLVVRRCVERIEARRIWRWRKFSGDGRERGGGERGEAIFLREGRYINAC
jgi:hypothetical protein